MTQKRLHCVSTAGSLHEDFLCSWQFLTDTVWQHYQSSPALIVFSPHGLKSKIKTMKLADVTLKLKPVVPLHPACLKNLEYTHHLKLCTRIPSWKKCPVKSNTEKLNQHFIFYRGDFHWCHVEYNRNGRSQINRQ